MAANAALLVVDVQQGLIDGFEPDWRQALPAITLAVSRAHEKRAPVVFVQHCGTATTHPLHRSQPGWGLHRDLDVRPDDLRVEKTWSDAFRETKLDGLLRDREVGSIVLVGAQTEYCVDATARRALSLGYDVQLVGDGHTTSANGLLVREQIVAHHNQTLANLATVGSTLTIIPSKSLDFSKDG